MTHKPFLLPGDFLTVVIRDDAPFVHLQASPSYRSVRVLLSWEQREALKLHHTDTRGGDNHGYESIDRCFIEDLMPQHPALADPYDGGGK